MAIKTIIKGLCILAFNPQILFSNSRYLFIISHMRSRSTLLSHILGSNPEIAGYTELHQSYSNWLDLFKLKARVFLDMRNSLKNKYLLDKVLHNNHDFSDDILHMDSCKFIFLVREPEKTIKSIINMGYITKIQWYTEPDKVLDYYCERIQRIEELATVIGEKSFFIDAETLVTDPDKVLHDLSEWLELKTPLDKNYSTFKKTGVSGYGDPSEVIKQGTIVKTDEHKKIILPEHIIRKGSACYESCKKALRKNCASNSTIR